MGWLRKVDLWTMLFCLAVVAFNLVDTFCTLRHLRHGGVELNPLMDALIRRGTGWFVGVKLALAVGGSCGLAWGVARGRERARVYLGFLAALYALVAVYQTALFLVIK